MNNLTLSPAGIDLIKGFEGLRLSAYRDSAGVWTIGYGSTRYHDGKHVAPGDKLANEAQATALLMNTMGQYVEAVNRYVEVKLNQNQFDALVSFTYNEGTGALEMSSLLSLLNKGNYSEAADHFLVWDEITDPATGKKVVSETLVARRKAERAYFLRA